MFNYKFLLSNFAWPWEAWASWDVEPCDDYECRTPEQLMALKEDVEKYNDKQLFFSIVHWIGKKDDNFWSSNDNKRFTFERDNWEIVKISCFLGIWEQARSARLEYVIITPDKWERKTDIVRFISTGFFENDYRIEGNLKDFAELLSEGLKIVK